MINEGDWYRFTGTETIDTPALLIYPERVVENIERLKQLVASPQMLRPHVKTHKSLEVSRLMISACINKFKCATIAEADMLGKAGAADVLLAYQPTQTKLQRLLQLIEIYPDTKYSCLIDNTATAAIISEAAQQKGIVIPVYIDLNVGMNRTGIPTQYAFELYSALPGFPGIKFMGFHAYDGHIKDADLTKRTQQCQHDFAAVEALREKIAQQGHPFPLLIAGGSPTFAIHASRQHTECSPGTFVFWDDSYHRYIPEQQFLFAALVLTRVVSLPHETKICIDMGYKSITCENDLQSRAHFLNAPNLKPCGHSEEHMVLTVDKGHNYQIGDILYALPEHICPTVAMYDNACIIETGKLIGQWAITARGRTAIA